MQIFEWVLILLGSAVVLTAGARRLKLPCPSMLALGDDAFHRVGERLDYAEVNVR